MAAVLGYVFTYRTGRRLDERRDQLARINAQLTQLYGPLLVLVAADTATWEIFRQKNAHGRAAFFNGDARTPAEIELWVTWVKAVWMPTNRKIFNILVSHGDLIVDNAIPKVFLDFCAHVQSYEAVLAQWEKDDLSVLFALIDHPGMILLQHVEERYAGLKGDQAKLLATTTRPAPSLDVLHLG